MKKLAIALAAVCALAAGIARADVNEVRIANQYGFNYMPLVIMHHFGLIEKHAKALGIPNLKVRWNRLGGASAMNDALLSGSLDVASGGMPSMVTLWGRTHGEVLGIGPMHSIPFYLNTRDPKLKSIKDLTAKDRIAVVSVKISTEALLLQYAAAQIYGAANYAKLDPLTISMTHPDAAVALITGNGSITADFSAPPFQFMELEHPGIHTVTTSFEIMGGPFTSTNIWTTRRFREKNPTVFKAIFAAYLESFDIIDRDKRAAAKAYVETTGSKESVDEIYKFLTRPDVKFTYVPHNIMKMTDFMYRIGVIKAKPASWRDLYVPEARKFAGS